MAIAGLDMTTIVVFTEGYTGEVPSSRIHQQLATPVLKQAWHVKGAIKMRVVKKFNNNVVVVLINMVKNWSPLVRD